MIKYLMNTCTCTPALGPFELTRMFTLQALRRLDLHLIPHLYRNQTRTALKTTTMRHIYLSHSPLQNKSADLRQMLDVRRGRGHLRMRVMSKFGILNRKIFRTAREEGHHKIFHTAREEDHHKIFLMAREEDRHKIFHMARVEGRPKIFLTARVEDRPKIFLTDRAEDRPKIMFTVMIENRMMVTDKGGGLRKMPGGQAGGHQRTVLQIRSGQLKTDYSFHKKNFIIKIFIII